MKHLTKLPAFILVLGGLVRIAGTGSAALWYDEAITLYRTYIPFLTLFSDRSDASGDLLLDLLTRPLMALGDSLWLLRLPSLMASLVGLWLVYKLMIWLEFNLTQRVITSGLVAFLPGLLWIAQDARSYSLVSALFLAMIWFAINRRHVGMIACGGLLIYSHTTGAVYAITALIIFTWLYPRPWHRPIFSSLAILISWIPAAIRLLLVMPDHMADSTTMNPWGTTVLTDEIVIRSTIHAMWTWTSTYHIFTVAAILIMLLTIPLVFIGGRSHNRMILLFSWTLPPAGIVFISLIWTNVLLYRTLMPILFAGCLWLGWGLGSVQPRWYIYPLRVMWLVLVLFALITWDPAQRGGRLDHAAELIRSEWQEGDVIVYQTGTVSQPFLYYLGDKPSWRWDGVSASFLMIPINENRIPGDVHAARRLWIITPDEPCVTPEEMIRFSQEYPHAGDPVARITYLQAAPINVYLVEK